MRSMALAAPRLVLTTDRTDGRTIDACGIRLSKIRRSQVKKIKRKEKSMLNDCDLIIIKIEPMGKPRLSRADIWRHRPRVERWYAYKDDLKCRLRNYHLPERLELEFYLPMPDSWSQHKKTTIAGQPHRQKPDVDNLAKGFMDALTDNDARVWDLHARKFWSWEGRIVVYRL